jgi:hypothetical protein
MTALGYLLRSLNVANGLLLAAVVASAWLMAVPYLDPGGKPSLPAAPPAAAPPAGKAEAAASPSPADYALIAAQNPFHPERLIPQERKELPRPEVLLYGTLVTDGLSVAFVEDRRSPYTTAGRGKRQRMVRKGESVSGYILQDVLADRVVLARGDDRIVVLLSDGEKRKAGAAAPVPPASAAAATAGSSPGAAAPAPVPSAAPAPGTPGAPGVPPAAVTPGGRVAAQASTAAAAKTAVPTTSWLPSTRFQRIEAQRKKAEIYRQNRLGSP